jgi:hypothetical protein
MAIRIRLGPAVAVAGTVKLPLVAELEALVVTILSASLKLPSRLKSIQMVHAMVVNMLFPPGVSV